MKHRLHVVLSDLRTALLPSAEPRKPVPLAGWIAVWLVAVNLFWVSVYQFVADYDIPIGVAFALATVQCATIPLAGRVPRTAIVLHLLAVAAFGGITRGGADDFWPLSIPGLVSLAALLVVIGLRESWALAVTSWWVGMLTLVGVIVTSGNTLRTPSDWGYDLLACVTVTLVAVAAAIAIGQRRRVRVLLANARRDVELEQARRQTIEERARIARELHDVVAHSMSIVHIQAESARFRVSDLDGALHEFDEIARSARSALREMRQLLGALRPSADEQLLEPQPTMDDLPQLVENAARVGTEVTLDLPPTTEGLSPLLQLTVYRIVQEALSNSVRHAPSAPAQVTIAFDDDDDTVTVIVDNAPSPSSGALADADSGSGQGLRGMRERVALLDGNIVQQARLDGGFRIAASLPRDRHDRKASR